MGCHMRSDEDHTFEATIRNATSITNIPTFEQACSVCHADEAPLISDMNSLYDGFEEALAVLDAKLVAAGIVYDNHAYPYYFNPVGPHIFPNAFTAWPDLATLGAAYNLALLDHEPGAYVHNSKYARMLIFDSIDFFEDGASPPDGVIAEAYINNATAYDYLNSGVRP